MKILVTGASGFVGSNIIEYLYCQAQYDLVALLRSPTDDHPWPNLEYRYADLVNLGNCLDLSDIDIIIHCAGRAHVMKDNSDNPLHDYRVINTQGTINLAKSAAVSGVKRFIFLSTAKVIGDESKLGSPLSVSSPVRPVDCYALSKLEAEHGLKKISDETSLEFTIVRPPLIYGVGVKGNLSLLSKVLSRRLPLPFGAIDQNRRSMIGIDNLLSVIDSCVTNPNARNQIFLVSDNSDLSTRELLRLLGMSLGKPATLIFIPVSILRLFLIFPIFKKKLTRLLGSFQIDISHTCETLDWYPPYSVKDGFKKLRLLENETDG